MALVAQAEREAISRRTKEALAVASRGVRLGNPDWRGGAEAGWHGRCAAQGAIVRNADRHAPNTWQPVVADIRSGGATSLRAIARRAEQPRHADPARRALARLDGDEPSRPARTQEPALSWDDRLAIVDIHMVIMVGSDRRCDDYCPS